MLATQARAESMPSAQWTVETGQPVLVPTDGWVIRSKAVDVNANQILNAMLIAPVSTSVAKTRARRAEQTPIATFK